LQGRGKGFESPQLHRRGRYRELMESIKKINLLTLKFFP